MSLLSNLTEKASQVYTNGVNAVGKVADEMENTANDIATKVENTAKQADKSLQDLGNKIDKGIDDVGTAIDNTTQKVGTSIDNTVKKVGIVFDNTVKNTGTIIDNGIKNAGTIIDNTVKDTGTIIDNGIKKAGIVIDNTITNVATNADKKIDAIGETLNSGLKNTTNIIDKNTGLNTSKYADEIINTAKSLDKKASDTIKNGYNNVKKVAKDLYTDFGDASKSAYNDVKKGTNNVYKGIESEVVKVYDGAKKGINYAYEGTKNEIVEVYDDTKKGIQKTKRVISDVVKKGYQKGKDVAINEAKKNLQRIKTGYSAVKQVGSSLVVGVKQVCAFAKTGGGTPAPEPIIIPPIGKISNPVGDPCRSLPSTSDMDKSKVDRYKARMDVINESKKQLSTMPDSAQKKALKDTVDRFELNNRAIERAKLADNIYIKDKNGKLLDTKIAGQVGKRNKEGDAPEGWKVIDESKPGEEPVYQVYEPNFETPAKPVLVFRGTDNDVNAIGDWKTNFAQGIGVKTKQYDGSIEKAKELKNKYGADNYEIAGHSKAGGQTTAASIESGAKGYAFNSAGVNGDTVSKPLDTASELNSEDKPLVDSFNFPGEVLSRVQDNRIIILGVIPAISGVLPTASGIRHVLPAQDINGNPVKTNIIRTLELHGMKYLINSMEKQKQDDLDNIAKAFSCK
jgi:hypothetical protein